MDSCFVRFALLVCEMSGGSFDNNTTDRLPGSFAGLRVRLTLLTHRMRPEFHVAKSQTMNVSCFAFAPTLLVLPLHFSLLFHVFRF
jgi:hypothetical protein